METLVDALDERRGVALASSYEYPGRYTRWDMGFVDPPLALEGRGRAFRVSALNERGRVLIPAVEAALRDCDAVEGLEAEAAFARGRIRESDDWFPEELRSRQPTVFSVVRALVALFAHPEEPHLGFYGAFGYELAFQFEAIRLEMARREGERDLVLYLPDDILVVDHQAQRATRFLYDFGFGDAATGDLPRWERESYSPAAGAAPRCDHGLGEYEETVRAAIEAFARGDLFEVVPGQNFYQASPAPPSEVFRRLRRRNPAPYGALLNLGEQEYLVAASPEMYVRVDGRRVETCPISGTIARGASPIEDSTQILALLNSKKDESELTMCTDVDRNDKSRVCVPGSVRVIGRRQIEMYSRLIHTVDHVVGELRDEFDALDAFLAHAWAVTVTGAPKQHAIQFIEDHERSPRRWYGGALGFVGFNGKPQYRADAAHRAHRGGDRVGARRSDPALRVRPRRGGGRDPPQGERPSRRDPPPGGRPAAGGGHASAPRRRQAHPHGGPRGLLRAHPRRVLPTDRGGGRHLPQRLPVRTPARGPARPGAALTGTRAARGFRARRDHRDGARRGDSPSSASASGCRGSWSTTADTSTPSKCPCTARRAR